MILAIDTSTRNSSVALYDPSRGLVASEAWPASQDQTATLAPRIEKFLDKARIDGLVVALGPGSFTGTRVGLSLAKGIALARSLPLVGMPTTDALARSQKVAPFPLFAILEAGRGRICVARYQADGDRWGRADEYRLTTIETLVEEVEGPAIFCGEIEMSAPWWNKSKAGAVIIPGVERIPYLAQLGWERLERGEADDLHTLEPIYLSSSISS